MAMSTAANSGGPVLTPEQVHSFVVQPLIDQSVAAQVSTSSRPLARFASAEGDPGSGRGLDAEGAEINVSDAVLDEIWSPRRSWPVWSWSPTSWPPTLHRPR